MKLLINNKYEEVGFWSFVKCNILVELALLGFIWGATLFYAFLLI